MTKRQKPSSKSTTPSASKSAPAKAVPSAAAQGRRRKVVLWIASASGIVLLVAALGLGMYDRFLRQYENRMYPGVTVAGLNVVGLTYNEALDLVDEKIDQLYKAGVTVQFTDPSVVDPEQAATSLVLLPDIVPLSVSGSVQTLYAIDSAAAVDAAFAVGREGNQFEQTQAQWQAWRTGYQTEFSYTVDEGGITELLQDTFQLFETPSENASIDIADDGSVTVVPEQTGQAFGYAHIVAQVVNRIDDLDATPITIILEEATPAVTAADVATDLAMIEGLLERTPITLTWEESDWTYDRATVGSWLTYAGAGELAIDATELEASLTEPAEEVVVTAQEGRWRVEKDEGGNLTGLAQLSEPQAGRTIDYAATGATVLEHLQGTGEKGVELTVIVEEPKFSQENANELGITDILGTGHSNMGGSPYNRRQNIARGAELLDGLLIPPNDEFSLVEALQPFTLENGYVAELVIKGNETTPEVGGGLCQIGTTTFRGAMYAGLDITARQNHSYAVSYYSDDRNGLPGTDATIYEGWPDLRFINDTPGYILLQTRIDGNDLYFDYWGTSDGRVADFTPPTISGWISPPPTKEVETTELAPGERRCTESAHAGTSAAFDYLIQYPDGTSHQETFTSTYKPWQAVCLVGATPDAAPAEPADTTEATPTDTEEPATDDSDATGVKKKKKKT